MSTLRYRIAGAAWDAPARVEVYDDLVRLRYWDGGHEREQTVALDDLTRFEARWQGSRAAAPALATAGTATAALALTRRLWPVLALGGVLAASAPVAWLTARMRLRVEGRGARLVMTCAKESERVCKRAVAFLSGPLHQNAAHAL